MKAVLWAEVRCEGIRHRIGLTRNLRLILANHMAPGTGDVKSTLVAHALGERIRCVEVAQAWNTIWKEQPILVRRARRSGKRHVFPSDRLLPARFRCVRRFGIDSTLARLALRGRSRIDRRAAHAQAKAKSLQTRIKRLTTQLKKWQKKVKRYETLDAQASAVETAHEKDTEEKVTTG